MNYYVIFLNDCAKEIVTSTQELAKLRMGELREEYAKQFPIYDRARENWHVKEVPVYDDGEAA